MDVVLRKFERVWWWRWRVHDDGGIGDFEQLKRKGVSRCAKSLNARAIVCMFGIDALLRSGIPSGPNQTKEVGQAKSYPWVEGPRATATGRLKSDIPTPETPRCMPDSCGSRALGYLTSRTNCGPSRELRNLNRVFSLAASRSASRKIQIWALDSVDVTARVMDCAIAR